MTLSSIKDMHTDLMMRFSLVSTLNRVNEGGSGAATARAKSCCWRIPLRLLIVSEKGELVLLKADPTKHIELAKLKVLEGKTWNHPVVAGDRLYIRNAQEAACYRLPLASGESANEAKVSAPAE